MAGEITVRDSLQISDGKLEYQSKPTSFNADRENDGGPTPGAIHVTTNYGQKIDLSQLNVPGMCWLQNLDDTLWVEFGIHNGLYFYPLLELGPGEFDRLRLSRHLNRTESITGTGTLPQTITDFWVKP